jgi:hypothetical protein
MKYVIALFVLTLTATVGHANCTNAYASAGYSLSHAKKSMEANNFEHQQYYAERALKAFEEAREQNENCGCAKAVDPILDGIENLKTALSQDKWDNGRFYTKKALEKAEQVLNNLDVCTVGVQEVELTQPNTEVSVITNAEEEPNVVAEPNAEEEWETKLHLKQSAEEELAALERSILELATLLNCDKAAQAIKSRKTLSQDDLRTQSLPSVRAFYLSQVVTLHNKALFSMIECSKK